MQNQVKIAEVLTAYSRSRNYLYTRMVAQTVKLRPILPQANSLCYKVDATSVNLFSDFTIIEEIGVRNPSHRYDSMWLECRSQPRLSPLYEV